MHLLADHPDDIQLSDVLGKYILTTLASDSVINYVPSISYVFNHFFENANKPMIVKGIDFSSYGNYIKTRNSIIYGPTYIQERLEDGISPYDD